MGTVCVLLDEFEIKKKQEITKDEAYLWAFPIIIDLTTMGSREFIQPKLCTHGNLGDSIGKGETRRVPKPLRTTESDVTGIVDTAVVGIVTAAWEHDTIGKDVQRDAYQAMCNELQSFISDKVDALSPSLLSGGQVDPEPTKTELRQLERDISDTVREVFKSASPGVINVVKKVVGAFDESIGFDHYFVTLDTDRDVTKRFVCKFCPKPSIDYRLRGEIRYSA